MITGKGIEYDKDVHIMFTGMAYAGVYVYENGECIERVNYKLCAASIPLFNGIKRTERALKKAHKWADDLIKIAEAGESRRHHLFAGHNRSNNIR